MSQDQIDQAPIPISSIELFREGRIPDGTNVTMGTLRHCANLMANEYAASIICSQFEDGEYREKLYVSSSCLQDVYQQLERKVASLLGLDTSPDPEDVDFSEGDSLGP